MFRCRACVGKKKKKKLCLFFSLDPVPRMARIRGKNCRTRRFISNGVDGRRENESYQPATRRSGKGKSSAWRERGREACACGRIATVGGGGEALSLLKNSLARLVPRREPPIAAYLSCCRRSKRTEQPRRGATGRCSSRRRTTCCRRRELLAVVASSLPPLLLPSVSSSSPEPVPPSMPSPLLPHSRRCPAETTTTRLRASSPGRA